MSSIFEIPPSALNLLTENSRACITRLQMHEREIADVFVHDTFFRGIFVANA